MPCSNAAKTRNPLKFAGLLQTTGSISAVSRPKFTILWGSVEDISLLNKFFPIVDTCLSCEDIARQSCVMVPRWRFFATFLRPAFPARRVQQVSDLHLKFALRLRPLRLGEEKKKELECGSMPNLMVALPNIGGALCSTPQSLADARY